METTDTMDIGDLRARVLDTVLPIAPTHAVQYREPDPILPSSSDDDEDEDDDENDEDFVAPKKISGGGTRKSKKKNCDASPIPGKKRKNLSKSTKGRKSKAEKFLNKLTDFLRNCRKCGMSEADFSLRIK
jgi:hypothetical protein